MIYIGIGSNLGNRKKNIEKAKFRITQNKVNIINCSNFYESDQSLVETEELLLLICQLFFCRLLLLPSEDLKVLSFDSIATMQKFKT